MPRIGRDPNVTRNELSAAESGASLKAQAYGQQQQAYEAGAQQATQQAQVFGSQMQQGEELKRQDQQLAEQTRHNQMSEAIAQDEQDVSMADKGLQSEGQSRADRLRQEMENGRLQKQMDKPLEVNGPDRRTIAPTEQRQQLEESKATTNRMNAQANYINSMNAMRKAKLSGDEEGAKKEAKSLEQPIVSAAELFDAGRNHKLTANQWDNIKQLAADNPDGALQQEIQTHQFGPRLGDFLQRRVSFSALQFMAATGDMPDGKLVDMASPAMVQFTQAANGMQSYLRSADEMSGGALSAALKIDSLAKRNQVVRQMTANAMLKQMAGQAQSAQMPIPSQGGASANPDAQPGAGPRKVSVAPGHRSPGFSDPAVQSRLQQQEAAALPGATAAHDRLREQDRQSGPGIHLPKKWVGASAK